MRWLFWSSVLLVLVGCGGHRAAQDPFAYDTSRPFATRDQGVVMSSPLIAVHAITFAGANGARVNAFLLVPNAKGRHPAALFLHGSGGTREDMLLPAAELAIRGAVTMTISQPNDTDTYRPLVVNARRALDLMVARADVDPERLGLVGYSLGAATAAILAGDEPRFGAVGIVAGRGSAVPRYWIRRTKAHLFFQAGTRDQVIPHAELAALIEAAPGKPRVRWYDANHGMSKRAFADQVAWQAAELGIG